MKKIIRTIIKHIKLLTKSIYKGKRLERNLVALTVLGCAIIVFGILLTVLNIVQGKTILAWTAGILAASGLIIVISVKGFRNRSVAIATTTVIGLGVFTFYALTGQNGGFSILWILLFPIAVCYFMSVGFGVILSIYFQLLLMVMFYTPLRENFVGMYSETFMIRFPILYFCMVLITGISMFQYHERTLFEVEYTDRLDDEVRRQTKLANDRANKLERLTDETVLALARAIDAKDKYTNGHSLRVSKYSVELARKLGWDENQLAELKREALLHDIGKIGVPDAVLNKPGKLTQEEYETIKSHTTIGEQIFKGLENMHDVSDVILYHHERYDGKGYPQGLAGKDIPDRARIVAIADAYDAMNSNRIYRPALGKEKIREELVGGSGKQFDPDYLPAFLYLFDNGLLA